MKIPGPLQTGRFLERPNRFLTIVDLDGERVEAHLPDPGRLEELLVPGRRVWLRPAAGAHRRTRYTLTLVEAPGSGELISVVTAYPNEMVAEALEAGRIAELSDWNVVAREWRRGRSRFDFLLEDAGDGRMLLEVKSVTLVDGDRGLFPDAVTARGARHVRELAEAVDDGLEAAVLFVVQRSDARSVTAARAIDPKFADALEAAATVGVRTLGYRCAISTSEARLTEPVPVHVGQAPEPHR